jgi:hypothetical protein
MQLTTEGLHTAMPIRRREVMARRIPPLCWGNECCNGGWKDDTTRQFAERSIRVLAFGLAFVILSDVSRSGYRQDIGRVFRRDGEPTLCAFVSTNSR